MSLTTSHYKQQHRYRYRYRYPLGSMLGGPQNWYERFWKKKKKSSFPVKFRKTDRPARSKLVHWPGSAFQK